MFLQPSHNHFRSDWLKYFKDTLQIDADKAIYGCCKDISILSNSLKQKVIWPISTAMEIRYSSRGLSYKLFKHTFDFEEYLNILID